eukprot:SAG22_NODE_926_length_6466_cov_55.877179_2_plen_118_part_00
MTAAATVRAVGAASATPVGRAVPAASRAVAAGNVPAKAGLIARVRRKSASMRHGAAVRAAAAAASAGAGPGGDDMVPPVGSARAQLAPAAGSCDEDQIEAAKVAALQAQLRAARGQD